MRQYAVTLVGCLVVLAAALAVADRASRVDDPAPLELTTGSGARSAQDGRRGDSPRSTPQRRRGDDRRRRGGHDVRQRGREGDENSTAAHDGAAEEGRSDRSGDGDGGAAGPGPVEESGGEQGSPPSAAPPHPAAPPRADADEGD